MQGTIINSRDPVLVVRMFLCRTGGHAASSQVKVELTEDEKKCAAQRSLQICPTFDPTVDGVSSST